MKRYWLSIVVLQAISLYSQEEMEYAGEPSPIESRYEDRLQEAAEIEHEEAERAHDAAHRLLIKHHEHVSHESAHYADSVGKETYDSSMVNVHIPDMRLSDDANMSAELQVDEAREVHAADNSMDALSDLIDKDAFVSPCPRRMQDSLDEVMRQIRYELGPDLTREELEDVQRMVRDVAQYVYGEVGNVFNEELFKKSMRKLYKSIAKAIVRAHVNKRNDRTSHLKKKLKGDTKQGEKAIVEQMHLDQLRRMKDSRSI